MALLLIIGVTDAFLQSSTSAFMNRVPNVDPTAFSIINKERADQQAKKVSTGCANCGKVQVIDEPKKLVFKRDENECICDVPDDGLETCICNGQCTEEQKAENCQELLGGCDCYRQKTGGCECRGYCATREKRAQTCNDTGGCVWQNFFCSSQDGMPVLRKHIKWSVFVMGFDQVKLEELRQIRQLLRAGEEEETYAEAISNIVEPIRVVKVPTN